MRITRLTGLVGAGIGYSLSPPLHETEGHALGLPVEYVLLDTAERTGDLASPVRLIRWAGDNGFVGVNVSVPHKRAALEAVDSFDELSEFLGAINTIVFSGDGTARGFNTDAEGFGRGVDESIGPVRGDVVVQFGAGGAGSATAYALASRGIAHLDVIDLDARRANELARTLTLRFPHLSASGHTPDEITQESLTRAHGVVNATPMGGHTHPGLLIPADWHRPDLWAADVVYAPLATPLIANAQRAGARTAHGGLMLAYQAALSFRLFHGVTADAARMRDHLITMCEDEVAS